MNTIETKLDATGLAPSAKLLPRNLLVWDDIISLARWTTHDHGLQIPLLWNANAHSVRHDHDERENSTSIEFSNRTWGHLVQKGARSWRTGRLRMMQSDPASTQLSNHNRIWSSLFALEPPSYGPTCSSHCCQYAGSLPLQHYNPPRRNSEECMYSPQSLATHFAALGLAAGLAIGCSASATDNTDSNQGTGDNSGQPLGGRASSTGGSSSRASTPGGSSSRSSSVSAFICEANERCPAASNRATCTNAKGQTCTCFSGVVYCK